VAQGGVEQYLRPHDIGLDKHLGFHNAAVDVGFGGEVDHHIHAAHQLVNEFAILNSPLHELVPGVVHHFLQIVQAARIRQGVQVNHLVVRVFLQDVLNEVGADEARAAGD
jgi:hypothetical protein